MIPLELEIVTLIVGQLATNCYLVFDTTTREAFIIDPGDAPEYISDKLQELGLKPKMIVATHGHFDHIMGAFALQQAFNIPFCIHTEDSFLIERMQESAKHFLGTITVDPPPTITQTLENGEIVTIGRTSFTVIHTPGHTPGSICLYNKDQQVAFVGDTIFTDGSVGRTDFSYSNPQALAQSIRSILALPVGTELLSGHGDITTVRNERKHHIQ